ncbi:MAG: NfeD family protein [Chthoniobacteraceae bacterium]
MISTVIALATAGVALLFLEMFLPGLIAGIIGGILLIAAVFTAYSDIGIGAGNITLAAATAITAALWWWWATKFQHTRFGRSMTLTASDVGTSQADGLVQLAGQTGTAITPLRPSGTILVAGRRVDAITGGEFIEHGTCVRIVRAEGSAVIVHRLARTDSPSVPGGSA